MTLPQIPSDLENLVKLREFLDTFRSSIITGGVSTVGNIGCKISNNAVDFNPGFAACAFDTVEYDTDSMFSLSNPTRITINTSGKYIVGAWCNIVDITLPNGGFYCAIAVNDIFSTFQGSSLNTQNTGGGLDTILNISSVHALTAGQYLDFYVGGNESAPAAATIQTPTFWAQKIV